MAEKLVHQIIDMTVKEILLVYFSLPINVPKCCILILITLFKALSGQFCCKNMIKSYRNSPEIVTKHGRYVLIRIIKISKQHLDMFTGRLKQKSKMSFIIMSIIQFNNLYATHEVQSTHFDRI